MGGNYTGCFRKSFTNSIVIVIEFVKLFLKHPILFNDSAGSEEIK
jgi:hypothetical protein